MQSSLRNTAVVRVQGRSIFLIEGAPKDALPMVYGRWNNAFEMIGGRQRSLFIRYSNPSGRCEIRTYIYLGR